jgi:hypothetical protein
MEVINPVTSQSRCPARASASKHIDRVPLASHCACNLPEDRDGTATAS